MFCVSSYWEVKLNISHVALFSQELPYSQKNGQFPVRTAMFKKNFASISGKEGSVVNEILHVYIMPLTDVQGFSRNLGSLLPGCTLVLNYPTNCQTASLPWKRPMHSYYPSSYFIDKHTKIKYPAWAHELSCKYLRSNSQRSWSWSHHICSSISKYVFISFFCFCFLSLSPKVRRMGRIWPDLVKNV